MTFEDLEDLKPFRHPPLRYGPRGKVITGNDQVWVDNASVLWVVRSIETKNKGKRNERVRVYVGPYGREPYVLHSLAESTLCKTMNVWDKEFQERKESYEEWVEECRRKNIDPESGEPQ